MRKITERMIADVVSSLCIEANIRLRPDVEAALEGAARKESRPQAKKILASLLENAKVARLENIALCQDTGLPVVFVEIGRDVDIRGLDLTAAINRGVEQGYKRGYLRNSIISDPLLRRSSSGFSPCVIHIQTGPRKGLGIDVLPKGFGCENKTKLNMFSPTVSLEEVKDFIVESVREAGPDACPPYVVGIGIGGTSDYAGYLAKKALLKKVTSHKTQVSSYIGRFERDLLKKINKLNIGPMGLGGKTTALAVSILVHPTHIAGLPVCVNISCHALRSAHAELP